MRRAWFMVTITKTTAAGQDVKMLSIFMGGGVQMAVVFLGFIVTLVSLFVAEHL